MGDKHPKRIKWKFSRPPRSTTDVGFSLQNAGRQMAVLSFLRSVLSKCPPAKRTDKFAPYNAISRGINKLQKLIDENGCEKELFIRIKREGCNLINAEVRSQLIERLRRCELYSMSADDIYNLPGEMGWVDIDVEDDSEQAKLLGVEHIVWQMEQDKDIVATDIPDSSSWMFTLVSTPEM